MKKLSYLLSSVGFFSIFVMGIASGSARADEAKSPLRGAWSFSQFIPVNVFGPTAAAGTFIMNEDNSFTGHGVVDTAPSTFELDFTGSCTFRQGGIENGMDCTINVPAFGLTEGRFCVVMGKRGECFDEFRCVDTTEGLGAVQLVEFKRQNQGACQ